MSQPTDDLSSPSYWRAPSCNRESNRLGSDNNTSEWNLAGSFASTVDSSSRRRRAAKKKQSWSNSTPPAPSPLQARVCFPTNFQQQDNSDTITELTSPSTPPSSKPTNTTRVLLEVQPLKELIERNTKCPDCSGPVKAEITTCCIASHCSLYCTDCGWRDRGNRPAPADVFLPDSVGSPMIERTTDYAVNVAYVIAHLGGGDGGREAERLLGFLGLPNATTMERRSFPAIEERISASMHELNRSILLESLIKEIRLVVLDESIDFDEGDFQAWILAVNSDDPNLNTDNLLRPEIWTSADMGWQKRSSGRRYDSNSGHALLAGTKTRLPLAMAVKSKLCRKCDAGKAHKWVDCGRNHDGTAKAMEPQAILDMTIQLYDEFHVSVACIISDDDSAIKAKVRYCTADYVDVFGEIPTVINAKGEVKKRPNKGGLPKHIPQPIFRADPNHRKKSMKNLLYKLCGKKKTDNANLTMTRCDVTRLGVNFAYMARTLQYKEEHELVNAGKAVLEHHFDNHQYCGDFCRRKDLTEEEKKQQGKFYRCKNKDDKLYAYLHDELARFLTLDALKEVAHGGDTQVNESLNNTISWLAPKNKTYCGSRSLENRIDIAIGIHTLGTLEYYKRLFHKLGIELPADTLYYLQQKGDTRSLKIARTKTNDYKRKRMEDEYTKLKEQAEDAKVERAGRDGVSYEPAMGINGGYTEEELDAASAPKKKRKAVAGGACTACGGTTHSRITSKKCPKHTEWQAKRKATSSGKLSTPQELTIRDANQLARRHGSASFYGRHRRRGRR